MKATGVVRRIDELGRIVIPKEIRKVLKIRTGDSLEIYTDNSSNIILSKHSKLQEIKQTAEAYSNAVYKTFGLNLLVIDRETIVTSNDYINKKIQDNKISKELERYVLEERKVNVEYLRINNELILKHTYLMPVSLFGDNLGLIIVASEKEITEEDKSVAIILESMLQGLIE